MSTILKALRRLEEEKSATPEGRPLREEIASSAPPASAGGSGAWVSAVVALLLGLSVGAGVFWWLSANETEADVPTLAAATPTPPAPRAAPPVAPSPAPPERRVIPQPPGEGPPQKAFASEVEIVERPNPAPRIPDGDPIPTSNKPKPGSERPVLSSSAAQRARQAAADRAAVALPSASPPPPVAKAPAPPPAPAKPERKRLARAVPRAQPAPTRADAPPPAPPQKVAKAPAKPEPVPTPKEKPPAPVVEKPTAAANLPPFEVERTHWHPSADRRVAWLRLEGESESRRFVEGDVLGEHLVKAIEPAAIVLESSGGAEVRRQIGD